MLQRQSKILLANIIRHTDTHNRIMEEEECWKQRAMQRVNEAKEFHKSPDKYGINITNKECKLLLESRKVVGKSRAHMDCRDDTERNSYKGREETTSNFWMRQLDKVESRDPERWGHSGYKELYPQDFVSDSDEDNVKQTNKHPLSQKRCHSPEAKVKKKQKKCHSDRKMKEKKSKKKKRSTGTHDSEVDSRKECRHRKQMEGKDCSPHENKKKLHKRHKT